VLCCSFCFLISFRLGGELNLSKPATTICTNVGGNMAGTMNASNNGGL